MRQLNLQAFLAANFEGRIRLMNRAHGARLWSHQLALMWTHVLDNLPAEGQRDSPGRSRLLRELMALAPHSEAAEQAYQVWIGDNDRSSSLVPPPIVHLIVSCNKHEYKSKASTRYSELSPYLKPIFILVGDESVTDAAFDAGILTVSASDHYEGLIGKVLEGLIAVRRKFGRVGVLKIDDDACFIAPPRHDQIVQLIAATQYAGVVIGDNNFDRCWHVGKCASFSDEPYRRRYRGSWAAGPLYYLGPEAVELLVREYLFYPGEFDGEIFEDKAIADILGYHGLKPTSRDLSSIFGIAGPFEGSFGDQPSALGPLKMR